MGRRKQLNPVRRPDDEATLLISHPSTSTQNLSPPSTSDTTSEKNSKPKKFSDFSIITTLKKSSKPSDDLVSAQKAYQTLINGLESVSDQKSTDPLLSLYKQVEKLNGSSSNGNFKVVSTTPSNGVGHSDHSGINGTGTKRSASSAPLILENELENGDTALDLSVKKPRFDEGSALAKLSTLVTTVGTKPANFINFSKPDPNPEDNDPSKVFTCLQCFERFQTMDQLVKHMEKTLHFNQFKQANGKNDTQRDMKLNNRYSMFSYKCVICGHSSSNSIEEHMTKFHSFKTPMEWIHAVKLVPL